MLSLGLAIGVAVAVVLCAGLLALIALLGMRRFGVQLPAPLSRNATGPAADEKLEMEWDNELNIVVNPLDGLEAECAYDEELENIREQQIQKNLDTCSIKDEEMGNISEEDDEKTTRCPEKELEWDDSTLSY